MKSFPVLPEAALEILAPVASTLPFTQTEIEEIEEEEEEEDDDNDEWDTPIFAFHDLDYIPSGYGGILAPYIETGPGTMRAAATLMNLVPLALGEEVKQKQQVICDLGCGDGEFLIGLLAHVNATRHSLPSCPAHGLGIDYNGSLIATANINCISAHQQASWLVYDFNLDADNLLQKLVGKGVTHVFVYLVPKQLALPTVRLILEGCLRAGMCVCAHKFLPGYLDGVAVKEGLPKGMKDVGLEGRAGMELCVWGRV